jgi:hypothetical protein
VQVLPSPRATHALVSGVSGGGYVMGTFALDAGGFEIYAWTSPYTGAPVLVGPGPGAVPNQMNTLGDTPGGKTGFHDGVWLKTAGGWNFQVPDAGPVQIAEVSGLNDSREMIGWGYTTTGADRRAFFWDNPDAAATSLPLPAVPGRAGPGRGRVVNNVGIVAGDIYDTVGTGRRLQVQDHGVLWTRVEGGWTASLLPDMAPVNIPVATDDAGHILAVLGSAPGSAYGAGLWTATSSGYTATVLSTAWVASGMDRCGRVVGTKTVNNRRSAVLWVNGAETLLPTPAGYSETDAKGIATDIATGQGIIAGTAYPKGNTPRVAVIWTIAGCP